MAEERSGIWFWDDGKHPITLQDFAQYILAPMVARFERQWLEYDRIFLKNFGAKSKRKIGAQLRIRLPEDYEVRT